MRILLADDQKEVLSGLKVILEQESNMKIVGEVSELGSLIVKTQQVGPDVVMIDWELGNLKVSDIVSLLRLISPDLKVIAMSTRPESCTNALAAGADAFVSKGEQPEKLINTLKSLLYSGKGGQL